MELVANFTLNNEALDAQFDISEITNFDALFQIDGGAMWGIIGGNIHNQEDLQNEFDTLSTQIADNHSEITNINTTIEGYGDIVTYDATYFATATQGALADTALQPNDNISELNNNVGYITGINDSDVLNALGYTPVPNTLEINGQALTNDIELTASDVGAVPTSRTVNGKALSSNITLNAGDVGALPSTTTIGAANTVIQRNNVAIGTINANQTDARTINISVPTTATEVGALPSTTTINDLTNAAQQAALDSGINSTKVSIIASNTSAINSINSLIPSSTTASNPLTNEDFVNSSIATNTAYFIGTFNSVAELEAYSGTLTNNDYAFVVTTDSVGNTAYDRYKYNADAQEWLFEYELNNSSFTAEQWAAINSGANEQNISAIASNTSAITGLQNSKQDNLTAGQNIQINGNTISATDTTYTNGTGLNLSNTTFSVDFTEVAAVSDLSNYVQKSSIVGTITSTSTEATIPSAKCVYDELNTKADDSAVIKKNGTGQQTVTAPNNTPLGLKTTDSSNVCYMSFNNNNGYRASLGVNNNRQLVFWNNSTLYNVAMTANIPAIETTLTASSTNAKTVGAKCAYDALNLKQNNLTAGSNITISGNTISATDTVYTLPVANTNDLGGIKVGNNLSIDSNGVLSANAQSITIDTTLSTTSTNPVENRVITSSLISKQNKLTSTNAGNCISINGSVLPEGYTRLDYLQGGNGAYIDLGIIPTCNVLRVKWKGQLLGSTYGGSFMGCVSGTTPRAGFRIFSNANNGEINIQSYSNLTSAAGGFNVSTVDVTYDNVNATISGTINNINVSQASASINTTLNKNMLLFSAYVGNSVGASSDQKCWELEIEKDGLLVSKLIPCQRVSDSELGMYDVVRNTFLTNQGTGSFTAGNVVSDETYINFVNNNGYLQTSDIVTTISTTSTDATIPSAKCVYDGLSGKQDISNLVTSVSASSTDTQYPSAKLFYDTVDEIETDYLQKSTARSTYQTLDHLVTTIRASGTDFTYPSESAVRAYAQPILESGVNIKTLNGYSLLGRGDLLNNASSIGWETPVTISGISSGYIFLKCYANGEFICINGLKVLGSTDGINWTQKGTLPEASDPFDAEWQAGGLVYGNGTYVAVDYNGWVTTSTDLETWTTPVYLGEVEPNYYGIAVWYFDQLLFFNGSFHVFGPIGTGVSSDGVNWTISAPLSITTDNDVHHFAYKGGTLIGITDVDPSGICYVYKSTDYGATWSSTPVEIEFHAEAVGDTLITTTDDKFVIVTRGGYTTTSEDGDTWEEPTRPDNLVLSTDLWIGLCYGNGKIVLTSLLLRKVSIANVNAGKTIIIVNSYSNGTSFCDVYSDGRCIQGGIATGGTTNSGVEILFLKPFADTNYILLASGLTRSSDNFGTYAVATAKVRNLSTTSFYASTSYRGASSSGAYQPYPFSWLAIGKLGSSS